MPSTNFGSDINSVGLLQRLGEVAKSVDGYRYAKKPRTFSISGDGGGGEDLGYTVGLPSAS